MSKAGTGGNTSGLGPAGCWVTHKRLESWARVAKERAISCTSPTVTRNENTKNSGSCNSLAEEYDGKSSHGSQSPHFGSGQSITMDVMRVPQENAPNSLPHQSKSYPCGSQPRLIRTPSVSSQGSFDGSPSRQQAHRGSSPQIRTYGPDGRSHANSAPSSSYQTHSRSPSPHRAVSLDIRSSSPGSSNGGEFKAIASPSQTSLVSLAGNPTSSPPQSTSRGSVGRCLSPLLIPQKYYSIDCGPIPPASPLGALQPDLYNKKEGPLFLGSSSREGQALGRLHLRLKYDFDRSDLAVHLIEAHDLAATHQGGFNDPYVRLTMDPPVDTRKRQTLVHRNNPNPFFDQHFKFPVSHEDLQDKTLVLHVFDCDRFSRNDVIGEVRMPMEDLDVTSSIEVWGEVMKIKKPPEELQEVLLSLSYLPSAGRLTVVVLKARNLFIPSDKDNVDPFVKVNLIVNGKRVKKKKTACRKGNCNPVWNEALSFSISSTNLNQAALEVLKGQSKLGGPALVACIFYQHVCVMDQSNEFMSSNPLLGSCLIGPREEGNEKEHWLDMVQSPRKAIASWHTLR